MGRTNQQAQEGAAMSGPLPAILPLRRASLPLADLAPYPHAVTWALVWREGTNGKPGAWTKVLRNPRTGHNAKAMTRQPGAGQTMCWRASTGSASWSGWTIRSRFSISTRPSTA